MNMNTVARIQISDYFYSIEYVYTSIHTFGRSPESRVASRGGDTVVPSTQYCRTGNPVGAYTKYMYVPHVPPPEPSTRAALPFKSSHEIVGDRKRRAVKVKGEGGNRAGKG